MDVLPGRSGAELTYLQEEGERGEKKAEFTISNQDILNKENMQFIAATRAGDFTCWPAGADAHSKLL